MRVFFLDGDQDNFENEIPEGDFPDVFVDLFEIADLVGGLDEVELSSRFSVSQVKIVNTERFEPMGKALTAPFDSFGDGGNASPLFEEEFDDLVRFPVVGPSKYDAFHGMISSSDFAGSPKRFDSI